MKYSLTLVAFSLLVACSNAAQVTFKVIAPGATQAQVSVNGQTIDLTAKEPDVPYFTGTAEVGDQAKYKYVVGGTAEAFERTLEKGRTSTRNDFFDRPVTYANIPQLPNPIKDNPWTRGDGPQPLFDSNYIPTVFVNGDAAQIDNLVKNVPGDLLNVKLTFIGPEEVNTFNGVSFGIHGAGKKKNNAKQSWKWILPDGQFFANRNYFKIRHMEEDPTQLREKLYADILQALNTYGNRANMIRFFINGQAYGTFNLLDDVPEYSYIRAMFYGGNPPEKMGPLYDGASGADFAYHPNVDGYSSFEANKLSPADYSALDPLCKAFNETNVQDDAALANWGKTFDIDQYLRFMVMEYLTGHWDGYWMAQTNDGAYQDPKDGKWYYLGQDYDATFGVNIAEPEGREFVKVSYTQFPQRYPGAVLINRLLENAKTKATFETYLKDTVQVLFNNVTLTNRVLAYHDFILPDLKWDRSITQRSPGINFGWTFDQVTQNLWQGVSAPNANGGGADWGLIEWIAAKSQAVAAEFKITITDKVVGPANPTNNSTQPNQSKPADNGAKPAGPASNAAAEAQGQHKGAANNVAPQLASIVVLAAAAAALL
ncbi:coth protein-domain-containing protein [Radiomyces spectabilis]|uniref:coth protein-domain-containing protein n=1 Tax=Radiomyces spectabilis TaxID=64574 RepID=UPI00221E3B87|nr:coth protein-domain-containing protein [Radiomyces spectabilis]KAI8388794.1 coth protein-domain-containing protein [Radiomyces spectabilis]